jgi:hypothetical protein
VSARLPFALDTGDLLAPLPRLTLPAGAVFAGAAGDPPPVLTVAWLDEPAGTTLEQAVTEELTRASAESVLVDYEAVALGGLDAVRTLTLHREGLLTASEQWRLLAAGRRWTLSATTALLDQPGCGPRLAAVAGTFRVLP